MAAAVVQTFGSDGPGAWARPWSLVARVPVEGAVNFLKGCPVLAVLAVLGSVPAMCLAVR